VVSGSSGELFPPNDPQRGADFLDDDEPYWDAMQASAWLHGAAWHWSAWKEKPAVRYDEETGEESPAVWDHDHCHFCNEMAFSERYDDDLREGWLSWSPTEPPPKVGSGKYPVNPLWRGRPLYDTWVCPDCFERLRGEFDWVVTGPGGRPNSPSTVSTNADGDITGIPISFTS
jgi:hypothetical protein